MNFLRRLFRKNKRHVFEDVAGYHLVATTCDETWIERPRGNNIYAHLHRPVEPGRYPGVVFVPGGGSTGTDYDGNTEVTADDVAALGFTVLHYDPSGRGKTGGEENFWGPMHQEELAHVVHSFAKTSSVDADRIGILSFSIGIAIAAGALARFDLPVRYLFDWEGPSNRFNITKNDTHKPLMGFPTSNDLFWNEREPSRFMSDIPCGYFRYQGEEDHMQGAYKGHAVELINLATRGKAAWTKCNDNPLDVFFDEGKIGDYHWVPWQSNQKSRILNYLLAVQTLCNVQDHK
jgi:dienelactone hydrolase